MTKSNLSKLSLLIAASSLAACGGGSEAPTNKYDTNVTFPTASSNLAGTEQITVSGMSSDREDSSVESSEIVSISVNGVTADIDASGRWSAQIPTDSTLVAITVTAEYSNGEVDEESMVVSNNFSFGEDYISSFDYNTQSGNAVVVINNYDFSNLNFTNYEFTSFNNDTYYGVSDIVNVDDTQTLFVDRSRVGLYMVDNTGGFTTIVDSNSAPENGPLLSNPYAVAYDNQNRIAYVTDRGNATILAINLDTGERRFVTQNIESDAVQMSNPRDLVLDSAGNRLFVYDTNNDAILEVSIESGERRYITHPELGSGDFLNYTQEFVYDQNNNRLIVTNGWQMMAVDIETGNRTTLSGNETGTGTSIGWLSEVNLDSANNRAIAYDTDRYAVIAIDLSTGDRTDLVARPTVGSGAEFDFPQSAELDSEFNQLIVADEGDEALLGVDLETGDRRIISDMVTGTGPEFNSIQGVALDSANNRAIVIDNNEVPMIVAVDLDSGDRTIISDDTRGEGNRFDDLNQPIVINAAATHVYVLDDGDEVLVEVELASGNRRVVAEAYSEMGDYLPVYTDAMAIDNTNNRILLSDDDSLYAVNIENGEVTTISSPEIGTGMNLDRAQDIEVSLDGRTAYIIDNDDDTFFRVDLTTGDRTVISGYDRNAETEQFDGEIGNGMRLSDPEGLAIDFENNVAYIVNDDYPAVIVVDLNSGDRAIMSMGSFFDD